MSSESLRPDLVVNFTPTGMIPTKAMVGDVPVSVDEIVEDVDRAVEIGISMVHLHARDGKECPTYRQEIYGEIIEKIRRNHPELVICVSLSGRDYSEFEKRAAPLQLVGRAKPDMGSLTLSSLNFPRSGSMNSPDIIRQLAEEMTRHGILPELEVFDLGMMNYAGYLIRKGILSAPHYMNIILGNIATAQMDLLHAGTLMRDLPEDCMWSFGGIGDVQLFANTVAIGMGGGVRIGLEDNIYWDKKRTRKATNSMLLQRVPRNRLPVRADLHAAVRAEEKIGLTTRQRGVPAGARRRQKFNQNPRCMIDYVMFGHSGRLGDYIDILHLIGGHIKKGRREHAGRGRSRRAFSRFSPRTVQRMAPPLRTGDRSRRRGAE